MANFEHFLADIVNFSDSLQKEQSNCEKKLEEKYSIGRLHRFGSRLQQIKNNLSRILEKENEIISRCSVVPEIKGAFISSSIEDKRSIENFFDGLDQLSQSKPEISAAINSLSGAECAIRISDAKIIRKQLAVQFAESREKFDRLIYERKNQTE